MNREDSPELLVSLGEAICVVGIAIATAAVPMEVVDVLPACTPPAFVPLFAPAPAFAVARALELAVFLMTPLGDSAAFFSSVLSFRACSVRLFCFPFVPRAELVLVTGSFSEAPGTTEDLRFTLACDFGVGLIVALAGIMSSLSPSLDLSIGVGKTCSWLSFGRVKFTSAAPLAPVLVVVGLVSCFGFCPVLAGAVVVGFLVIMLLVFFAPAAAVAEGVVVVEAEVLGPAPMLLRRELGTAGLLVLLVDWELDKSLLIACARIHRQVNPVSRLNPSPPIFNGSGRKGGRGSYPWNRGFKKQVIKLFVYGLLPNRGSHQASF